MNAKEQYKLAYRLMRLIQKERAYIQKPYALYYACKEAIRELEAELHANTTLKIRVNAAHSLYYRNHTQGF